MMDYIPNARWIDHSGNITCLLASKLVLSALQPIQMFVISHCGLLHVCAPMGVDIKH